MILIRTLRLNDLYMPMIMLNKLHEKVYLRQEATVIRAKSFLQKVKQFQKQSIFAHCVCQTIQLTASAIFAFSTVTPFG